ncbi:MAG: hypothetical protein QOJ96_2244 [Alphaproteobacteria bacterium]|nr:hypothetical protein [Alphaproteobacteria bacterium]
MVRQSARKSRVDRLADFAFRHALPPHRFAVDDNTSNPRTLSPESQPRVRGFIGTSDARQNYCAKADHAAARLQDPDERAAHRQRPRSGPIRSGMIR